MLWVRPNDVLAATINCTLLGTRPGLTSDSPILLVQAALAMATPEQIQQALMALAQAASASAGGQLRPDDLQALFGPQWATLVAMPGGPISLPPEQLQQLATSEATAAFTQLVSACP